MRQRTKELADEDKEFTGIDKQVTSKQEKSEQLSSKYSTSYCTSNYDGVGCVTAVYR